MKTIPKARNDLTNALEVADTQFEGMGVIQKVKNKCIAEMMNACGWVTVTADNLPDTAHRLGFPVVGTVVYGYDC
jgi:hypothetical protein